MNRTLPPLAAFAAGLAALAWIAAGYLAVNLLALAATLLIAAFYLAGAAELRRHWQATRTLESALQALPEPPAALDGWLAGLHPTLQHSVRRRVESGAGALPGPALVPYLVGLLVLLGMLGTFVGMVATLRGTGLALETATDVATIRASLAAPVQGLGLAFGTSVAGVAASAMLGLASAFVRGDRLRVSRQLDDAATGALRRFSRAEREDAAHALLQRQAEALPALVAQLQAMAEQFERHSRETGERLLAAQDRALSEARQAQAALASTLERQLADGLAESTRRAGEAIQPVVEATLGGVAREAAALQQGVATAVERQLDGMTARLDATTARMTEGWQQALQRHDESGADTLRRLDDALQRFAATFEARSAALLQAVAQEQATARRHLAEAATALARDAAVQQQRSAEAAARQLEEAAARFGNQAEALLRGVEAAQAALQSALAEADASRLATWSRALEAGSAHQRQQWMDAAQQAREQQERICATLAQTADDIGAQSAAHARATVAEVERLVQAAAQAPQAAAEVVAGLRQQLSESMARDNAALAERERLLQTLGTLLNTIRHAAGEQRGAIDALVASSAAMLERAGSRFTARVESEAARMTEAAAMVAAGSADVASLADAFGHAVKTYGDSNEKLLGQLERIEGALGRSLARSDEQLAYYVAQARELVDLSIAAQQRIVDELQGAARRQAGGA